VNPCRPRVTDSPTVSVGSEGNTAPVESVATTAAVLAVGLGDAVAVVGAAGVAVCVAVGLGLGLGDGVGDGLGLGEGVGDGVGLGLGDGVGDGLGLGDGVGEGLGLGDGVALGEGLGVGEGEGLGVGLGEGEGVGLGLGDGDELGVGDGLGLAEADGLGDGDGPGRVLEAGGYTTCHEPAVGLFSKMSAESYFAVVSPVNNRIWYRFWYVGCVEFGPVAPFGKSAAKSVGVKSVRGSGITGNPVPANAFRFAGQAAGAGLKTVATPIASPDHSPGFWPNTGR
jgi:hypothetical protein